MLVFCYHFYVGVYREKMDLFNELADIFSERHNYTMCRELLVMVCRLSYVWFTFSFTYLVPDIAAWTDIPYISRSSAVRPTLRHLPQSTTQHPFPMVFSAFHFSSSIYFPNVSEIA